MKKKKYWLKYATKEQFKGLINDVSDMPVNVQIKIHGKSVGYLYPKYLEDIIKNASKGKIHEKDL